MGHAHMLAGALILLGDAVWTGTIIQLDIISRWMVRSCKDRCLLVVGVGGHVGVFCYGCLLDYPGGSFGYGLWLLLGDFFCLRLHYIFF